MRIMTYNIRLGIQRGLEPVAHEIVEANADIVALQEVGRFWLMGPYRDTARELSSLTDLSHFAYAPTIEMPGKDQSPTPAQYGHAILSRWPIRSTLTMDLPQIEDEPRCLLLSTIDSPRGRLRVLSTHLSHLLSDRPTQAQSLLDFILDMPQETRPDLILGDFNESDDVAWVQSLQQKYNDADQARGRLTFPADDPNIRIDYMFAKDACWKDVEVRDAATEVSDHLPVTGILHFEA